MADTLTILTADDPPVSLTPSRIVLAANSKVFADMLSLPSSGTNDQPITMAEKKADFEPFLRALAGEEVSLQPVQWETFARLGDKYDAFVVKHVVEKRICADMCAIHRVAVSHLIAAMVTEFDPADAELSTEGRWAALAREETCVNRACRNMCTTIDAIWRANPPRFADVRCIPRSPS
ncbi:hypothetical protein JCM10449v2_002937 [Rhodotorula kratochvilovae]